jgi:hypothetical protein
MTMGDTNSDAAATMEKLELLSATALLKQGIDGVSQQDHTDGKVKYRILETPSFGQMTTATTHATSAANSPSSIASAIPNPIFSVASTASVTGLLMQGASLAPDGSATNNSHLGTGHLASPVSADGDEEVSHSNNGSATKAVSSVTKFGTLSDNTLKASVSTHSLQQMIESRSPVTSIEYPRQHVVDAPTPPQAPFGYSLHPRYEAPAAFRPPMDTSAFSAFGGAGLGGDGSAGNHLATTAVDNGFYCHQQRQLPSPPHHHHQHHHQMSGPNNKDPMGAKEGQQGLSYEEMARELAFMRDQLKEKDMVVSSLQHRVNFLENKINELRQLPTGKISHIPVE